MSPKRVFKLVLTVIVCLILLPLVVLAGILIALTIPSVQQKAATAAARILSEKTGIEASVRHFSVRPPFDVLLEDVFAGDGKGDTLAFVGCLDVRLRIDALPDSVAVRHLKLENVTAHTGELLPSIRIDGKIGTLSAEVSPFGLDRMTFPIADAALKNADIALEICEADSGSGEKSPSDSTLAALSFDIGRIALKNVRFCLEPLDLKLDIGKARTSALIDLGQSCYTVRSLRAEDTDFSIGTFEIPVKEFNADAVVNLRDSLISSELLSIKLSGMRAQAVLHDTRFNLAQMGVSTAGEGSFKEYGLAASGRFRAICTGLNPADMKMTAELLAELDVCRAGGIDVSGVKLSANLNSGTVRGTVSSPVSYRDDSVNATCSLDGHFAVNDFMCGFPGIELVAELADIDAEIPGDTLNVSVLNLDFKTGKGRCNAVIGMPGIELAGNIPAHVLEIPSIIPSFQGEIKTLDRLDSLIASVPEVNAELRMSRDNPLRPLIQKRGFDLEKLYAALNSDGASRKLNLTLKTPDIDGKYRLPAMEAGLHADIFGSRMDAVIDFSSEIKDGLMSIRGIDSDVGINAVLAREGDVLKIDGNLDLTGLVYNGKSIGDRNILFNLRPDSADPGRFIAKADLDDIPVELAKQFVTLPEDIGIRGRITARAAVHGIPDNISLFVGVKPLDVAVTYIPYDVNLQLGDQEITMEGERINLNGLSIIGADSTRVTLDGGLDLKTMLLDVSLKSEVFEPVKLPDDGPIPVYGKLLAGLDGSITGPVDSLIAAIDVSILPQTDIIYPIDKKNLAQVSPAGTVKVGFNPKTGLQLGGCLDIPNGRIFFSPKLYPMMPFIVDKGSHIKFNGSIDDTEIAVSASQGAKATYKPVGEVSRMVDFITGVKVGGTLKEPGIGFYL